MLLTSFDFLGVGLGVALAKHQQMMIEQQLKAMEPKAKKRGNFAAVSNKEESSDNQNNSHILNQPSHTNNAQAIVPYDANQSAEHPPSTVSQKSSRRFL